MGEFVTTLAGAKHRQDKVLDAMEVMADGPTDVFFVAEPSNPHDKNAVRVEIEKKGLFRKKRVMIGYLPRDVAASVVDKLDRLRVTGAEVRGPSEKYDFWNIAFTLDDGE
jgi:hypothetical protein